METGDYLANVNVAVYTAITCCRLGIKLLVAASALEFRHQGSETFVWPAGTQRSNCQVALTSNLSVTWNESNPMGGLDMGK